MSRYLLVAAALAALAAVADAAPFARHETDRGPMLLGRLDEAAILAEYPAWPEELEGWQPDSVVVAALGALAARVDVLCVMGTWCGDSQREVPRFWKLLAAAGNDSLRLDLVAVGRADDEAAGAVLADLGLGADYRQQHQIEKVPTFIFIRGGKELGRIVETPVVSLEADTVAILRAAGLLAAEAPAATAGWR